MMARRELAVLALALWSTRAGALEPVNDDIHNANNQVGVSIVGRHLAYEEDNNGLAPTLPAVLDTESGWLVGFLVEGKIQQRIFGLPNVYIHPSVDYAWGSVEYDGRTQPTAPGGSMPVTATSGASILDLGLDLGLGVPVGDRVALTPILRYGYRHWGRTLLEGSANSFKEDYAHHELGVGLLVQVAIAPHLVGGASGTVGGTVGPGVSLTPAMSALSLDLGLGSEVALRGELSLDYALATVPRVHFFAAYDAYSFSYGQSNPVMIGTVALQEPPSSTLQHDLRAGIAIGF